MKNYLRSFHPVGMGTASTENTSETNALRDACQSLREARVMTAELKTVLEGTFQKRLAQAMALVEHGKVHQLRFEPSGRTLWVVNGKKGEYQVVPESMFCTCDDYYFRVMGKKKELCYHIIAQSLAEAMGRFGKRSWKDQEYARFTAKWKPFAGNP